MSVSFSSLPSGRAAARRAVARWAVAARLARAHRAVRNLAPAHGRSALRRPRAPPAGRRHCRSCRGSPAAEEVDDRELLGMPIEGLDVYVTSKEIDGKTLTEVAKLPEAHGVFVRKITRGATAIDIPVLPDIELQRGDIVTLVGRTPEITAATKVLGYPDRATTLPISRSSGRPLRSAPFSARWFTTSAVCRSPWAPPAVR